jgi:hypothetical protein
LHKSQYHFFLIGEVGETYIGDCCFLIGDSSCCLIGDCCCCFFMDNCFCCLGRIISSWLTVAEEIGVDFIGDDSVVDGSVDCWLWALS